MKIFQINKNYDNLLAEEIISFQSRGKWWQGNFGSRVKIWRKTNLKYGNIKRLSLLKIQFIYLKHI